tara:strand:- start:71 stop:187 length:117 start_codon:yes stop_codon:yes gene_type:complete
MDGAHVGTREKKRENELSISQWLLWNSTLDILVVVVVL